MRRRRESESGDQEIAELAALADGSLPPERRAALEARVAASPELADRLAQQRRAVEMSRNAAAEIEAPAALRARIEAQRRPRHVSRPRGLVLVGVGATADWPSRSRWPFRRQIRHRRARRCSSERSSPVAKA